MNVHDYVWKKYFWLLLLEEALTFGFGGLSIKSGKLIVLGSVFSFAETFQVSVDEINQIRIFDVAGRGGAKNMEWMY